MLEDLSRLLGWTVSIATVVLFTLWAAGVLPVASWSLWYVFSPIIGMVLGCIALGFVIGFFKLLWESVGSTTEWESYAPGEMGRFDASMFEYARTGSLAALHADAIQEGLNRGVLVFEKGKLQFTDIGKHKYLKNRRYKSHDH